MVYNFAGATVNVMEPAKENWKWPDKPDSLFYYMKDIKKK